MNQENEMENRNEPYLLCGGENCPLKSDCKRFRRDLNMKKEDHFAWPPIYKKEDGNLILKDECFYFDKKNEIDHLFDKIKNICGDDKDKNRS